MNVKTPKHWLEVAKKIKFHRANPDWFLQKINLIETSEVDFFHIHNLPELSIRMVTKT